MQSDYLKNQTQAYLQMAPVVAIVVSLEDPDKLGRVKVKYPWLDDSIESGWARVVAPFAGNERGIQFLPEVGDEVLVVFQMGNIQKPIIAGGLWNGKDLPPSDAQDGKNHLKIIKTTALHKIEFNDDEENPYILITDGKEKNSIKFDMKTESLEISSTKKISILSKDGEISLKADKIKIEASSKFEIKSGGGVDVNASGSMNLNGATINLN